MSNLVALQLTVIQLVVVVVVAVRGCQVSTKGWSTYRRPGLGPLTCEARCGGLGLGVALLPICGGGVIKHNQLPGHCWHGHLLQEASLGPSPGLKAPPGRRGQGGPIVAPPSKDAGFDDSTTGPKQPALLPPSLPSCPPMAPRGPPPTPGLSVPARLPPCPRRGPQRI